MNRWLGAALAALFFAPSTDADERLLFIGQDLDSIAGYVASDCCPPPDGLTAYVSLFNVGSEGAVFGGLGLDAQGRPDARRADWGAGPKNAYETATRFGAAHLAMGLSITENGFAPLFSLMAQTPSIRILAYINANWDDQPMWANPYASGYWGDSRLEVSPPIAERFASAIHDWKRDAE